MYILHAQRSGPSARALAQRLGASCGKDLPPNGTGTEIVRWGSYKPSTQYTALNKPEAIAKATDKYMSMELFQDAGVNVPKFSTDPERLTWPILGRSIRHRGGKDIVLYVQRKDLDILGTSEYYIELVPKHDEYRVHVFGRRCAKLSVKTFEGVERKKYNAIAWNRKAGFRFRRRNEHTPPISFFSQYAILAIDALGLDFGAVDMFIGEDGNVYVTEVNTAPGLCPNTVEVYANNITRLLGR